MKINLSDGGWIELRDPREITERQIEALEDVQYELFGVPGVVEIVQQQGDRGFEKLQDTDERTQLASIGPAGLKLMRRMRRVNIVTYVAAWSFGPNVNEDALLDLPKLTVEDIAKHVEEHVSNNGGGPHIDVDPTPDKDSPTRHSDD